MMIGKVIKSLFNFALLTSFINLVKEKYKFMNAQHLLKFISLIIKVLKFIQFIVGLYSIQF